MEILGADLEFVGRPEIDPERGAPTPAILVAVGDIAIFGRIIVGGDGRGVATPVGKGPVAAIVAAQHIDVVVRQIGRASCRERVCQYVSIPVVAVSLKKNIINMNKENRTRIKPKRYKYKL